MNTDAYYEMGSSHQVCEDYALSGIYQDMAYAIISDGCSSSINSDVGARLIGHIAKGVVIYLKDRNLIGATDFPNVFKELIVRKAIEVKNSLGLSTDAFDATLLVNIALGEKVFSIAWGDGYIIYMTKESKLLVYDIGFSSGAPYYLSYEMNQAKKQNYMTEFGTGTITINSKSMLMDGTLEWQNSVTNTILAESLYKEGLASMMKFATVSSDGLGTYQDDPKIYRENESDRKSYEAVDIIPLVMAYKNITGEFAVRRMQRLRMDMDKAKIVHLDDVSCASIAL